MCQESILHHVIINGVCAVLQVENLSYWLANDNPDVPGGSFGRSLINFREVISDCMRNSYAELRYSWIFSSSLALVLLV